MAKLQAATVSNQVIRHRKRKRKDSNAAAAPQGERVSDEEPLLDATTTTTTVPTKTIDGGSKVKRTTKSTKPALKRHGSSQVTECSIVWPEHFTQLSHTHRALNLVFTFCCTRKHLATTFETIKSAVESHTKRELSIRDIAEIKCLIPQAITFQYVDESKLQVNLLGEDKSFRGRNSKVGGLPPLERIGREDEAAQDEEYSEVLLFEFIDRDLKRQVVHAKTGEPTKATQHLRREDLKMPVYSQKQMLNMIEKRNASFTSAINKFINTCVDDKLDPLLTLQESVQDHVPQPTQIAEEEARKKRLATLPSTIPAERKSIPEIINEIKALDWYSGQIVPDGHRVFDPQEAIYGELNFPLSQSLVNALYNVKGINKVYAHQAEAINNLHDGHHVIISTSTSSGKSLIYQLPVLHELEQNRNSRALYIFPTKALAQDQRRSLKDIMSVMNGLEDMVVETFDGDTPKHDRNVIRDEARIIFTNPDMLHITILPQEDAWRTFLQNLRYVVVDELHVYNGLFGSHVAFIMRRLRRICAAIGNRHVKFISCSATVANPEEHMKTIFGIDEVKLTDFDGSPSGRKEFVCWNTPFKDPQDPTSGRGDVMAEAARVYCQLILRGVRVIAFCRIRKQCELILNAVKHELNKLERPEVMARVMAYRGGYTPPDRRKIEKEMFDGKLVGIVATNALELGIDIGSLDAVVTVGFPYTIANLRQQSGRAGRRNKDSLSLLVGDCFPTDQHYMCNPDEIFTKPNCELQVDLNNVMVVEGHAQCAAYEMPLHPAKDSVYFGASLPALCAERMTLDKETGFYHCADRFRPQPSRFVAIRDTEEDHFAVINTTGGRNEVLEELEASRAFFTIYEGGIFLHQGFSYMVKEFLPDRMMAFVHRVNVDWITQQRDFTDIDPCELEAVRRLPTTALNRTHPSRAFYGTIRITQVVFGFFKLDKRRRILDAVEVDNPPIILHSKGMWLDVPKAALEILSSRRLNLAAAIHAAEHAVLSLMPTYVISMPGDVKTECKFAIKEFAKKESQRKRPARLTFYDAKGGASGSGISTKAFEFVDELLSQAAKRVAACHCAEGCLECCCDERCREANQVMSKAGAEVVLRSLLGWEIDVDSLPWGPDEDVGAGAPAGIQTIVEAKAVMPRPGAVVRYVGDEEAPSEPAPDEAGKETSEVIEIIPTGGIDSRQDANEREEEQQGNGGVAEVKAESTK